MHLIEKHAHDPVKFHVYPMPPKGVEVREGNTYLPHPYVMGLTVVPDLIVWYSYFDDVRDIRTALAISNTPTYPNIRTTLPWDDKMQGLVMALAIDSGTLPRGYILPRQRATRTLYPGVLKWGNNHCGEGKQLVEAEGLLADTVEAPASEPLLVEPFVRGKSVRVLKVYHPSRPSFVCQLEYTSEDWRKNVNATVTQVEPSPELVQRALNITRDLQVAGVDFIVPDDGSEAHLLEVNCYPTLDYGVVDGLTTKEAFAMRVAHLIRHPHLAV